MDCSICFDALTNETGSTTLSCQHTFHFRCIVNWFDKQIGESLEQTCPCCRGKGSEMDRCEVKEWNNDDDEEEDDEDYEEDEEGEEDTNSILDEIPDDARDLLWERVGEGRWLITSRQDLAYEALRGLFGSLNELDVDPSSAAQKIQAVIRGHLVRQRIGSARLLASLRN